MRPALLALLAICPALAAPPDAFLVEKRTLTPTLTLTAVLGSPEAQEIRFLPEAYPENFPLLVLEAARAGTAVRKGDLLLRLDPARIEALLLDAEVNVNAASEESRILGDEFKILVAAGDASVAQAEDALKQAGERLKSFREAEAPNRRKERELAVLAQVHGVQDAEDELAQLEAMYKASELAHETKEIVLERSRRDLARRRENLALARAGLAVLTERTLPQEEAKLVSEQATRKTALEEAASARRIRMDRKRVEVDRSARKAAETLDSLERLKRDRKRMTVMAPEAGIVIHLSARNALSGEDLGTPKISAGDRVSPYASLMCVVPERPTLAVARKVKGEDRARISVGQPATVTSGNANLKASVEALGPLPVGRDGTSALYEVRFALSVPASAGAGATAEVKVAMPGEARECLAIPLQAVARKGKACTCRVRSAEGQVEEREVELGLEDGDYAEVKRGLTAGETLLPAE